MEAEHEGFSHRNLPYFLKDTAQILRYLKELSDEDLKSIWQTSEKLAQLNINRIRSMDLKNKLTPAILSFQGLQYQYIGAQVLSYEELDYLEEHLCILSGFYGLLKPLDGVLPYRLEMKSTFKNWEYANLYEFWGNKLALKIQSESSTLLNLASKEYSQVISKYLTKDTRMIDFVFGELIDGRVKQKATLLKMARGEMVQFLAANQVTEIDQIKEFNQQGYVFSEEFSEPNYFVFIK